MAAFEVLDAVAVGDLDAARAGYVSIAGLERPAFPEPWQPFLQLAVDAAVKGSAAEEMSVAATQIGKVGAACGGCHSGMGGGPIIEEIDTLKWAPGTGIARHRWGADLLWLGIVSRSDRAWAAGVAELDSEVPRAADLTDEAAFAGREQALREAARAALPVDVDDRPAAHAVVLQVCASCHGPD